MIRLGILGGGQLAQMTIQSAIALGIETVIFERKPDSPASRLTHHNVVGEWTDDDVLNQFTELCDVITLENEFVDAEVLVKLESMGLPVYPSSHTLGSIQDKLKQKRLMFDVGIPVPKFHAVDSPDQIISYVEELGLPMILKARRNGYDGYGNATINKLNDVLPAWEKLGGHEGRELLVEQFVPFTKELAVMVLRGRDGEVQAYPIVETIQKNHICHVVLAPADSPHDVMAKAQNIAKQAVEAVDGVGVFGVELFLLENGEILFNEMAPRPHNSGHYTIEGCVTSQFENHMRAVLGWSLGSTEMVNPCAVMVNILGERQGTTRADGIADALSVPNAHVHIYGKRDVRVGRKMGHVTVLGDSLDEAEKRARQAVELINL